MNAQHGPQWGVNYNFNQDLRFRNYDNNLEGLTEIKNGVELWTRYPYNNGETLSKNHSVETSLFIGKLNVIGYRDSAKINKLPFPESGDLGTFSIGYKFLSRRNHRNNSFLPHQGYGINIKFLEQDKPKET